MNVKQILDRGILERKFADETFSHTGRPDFQPDRPEILKIEPKPAISRPRTKQSANNSYT
jgi:hypothetical protein